MDDMKLAIILIIFCAVAALAHAVRKHLSEVDCFSSREALISALRELLLKPVEPSMLPCRADQYLACQKRDIEFVIEHLTSLEEPREKPWLQKLFGR
jgi:hypothetical protein